jgi:hypothetical protein
VSGGRPADRRTPRKARDYCDHRSVPVRPRENVPEERGTGDPACPQESGPD